MHHHQVFEAFLAGGGLSWLISAITSTMPPYTGNNYWMKWLWALLHVIGATIDKVHIPGSPADIAAAPKDKTQ